MFWRMEISLPPIISEQKMTFPPPPLPAPYPTVEWKGEKNGKSTAKVANERERLTFSIINLL